MAYVAENTTRDLIHNLCHTKQAHPPLHQSMSYKASTLPITPMMWSKKIIWSRHINIPIA